MHYKRLKDFGTITADEVKYISPTPTPLGEMLGIDTMKSEQKKIKKQPEKVRKIVCPSCGELQMKIYPWSNIFPEEAREIPICKRCENREVESVTTNNPNKVEWFTPGLGRASSIF